MTAYEEKGGKADEVDVVYSGNCVDVLVRVPGGIVDCTVTSPPY